jgi:hypothetical protein
MPTDLMRLPLRPGVWKVKLMFKWEVVAETAFLVTPLTTFQHKTVSLQHVIASHNGPGGFYIGKDFHDFNKVTTYRRFCSNAYFQKFPESFT